MLFENLTKNIKKIENKIFQKKTLKSSCQIKRNCYFCTRFEKQIKSEKTEEHVPRHIELTAVLVERLEQIK